MEVLKTSLDSEDLVIGKRYWAVEDEVDGILIIGVKEIIYRGIEEGYLVFERGDRTKTIREIDDLTYIFDNVKDAGEYWLGVEKRKLERKIRIYNEYVKQFGLEDRGIKLKLIPE